MDARIRGAVPIPVGTACQVFRPVGLADMTRTLNSSLPLFSRTFNPVVSLRAGALARHQDLDRKEFLQVTFLYLLSFFCNQIGFLFHSFYSTHELILIMTSSNNIEI